ncbi:uncharacterized protein LOC114739382 [Neltuma alba]|uniref:uncharacterized protein LOC114739382 n=1 Tax=Neltuma alba TaxID=207710 RepID=UPI0010A4973B|nr:uncharacterized protein LOC114739382 [Prosopis alba]
MKDVKKKCGMDEEWYVDPVGRSGGMALWWKKEVVINAWHSSRNIIHTSMNSTVLDVPDFVTYVYGAPRDEDKEKVWEDLRRIAGGVTGSWLCVGDFNDMVSCFEKFGSRPIDLRRTLNFQRMLSDCGLIDLNFNGAPYTWNNKRLGEAHVKERIDRATANVEFREKFQNALVIHIEPVGSDHHMLSVECEYKHSRVPKAFRFEAFWIEHEDFLKVVREGW